MESGLVLLQLAVPLLAVKLGADWVMLGNIGWIAQAIRTPICMTSGRLSERVGRATIIVPSAMVCAIVIAALSQARSIGWVIVLYAIALASIGAFYPPLQALIGDASERGQLRKNLGMFNVGWCVGGAVTAAVAGVLVRSGLNVLFFVGAGFCFVSAILVLTWRGKRANAAASAESDEEAADAVGEDFGPLLPIARMGHFVGFFGFSVVRILFVKMGVTSFAWSKETVANVVAIFLWGLSIGILITNVSPWWRGKLWPQVLAQLTMLICAAGAALVCSPVLAFARSVVVIGVLFFLFGMAQSVAYTGALYYGLSSRKGKGANTGLHEALVAAGSVSGCLLGGLAAQRFGVAAPFTTLAVVAAAALLATAVIWARRQARVASA